jgi:hypothetical protein
MLFVVISTNIIQCIIIFQQKRRGINQTYNKKK